jgi:hypothetical protein
MPSSTKKWEAAAEKRRKDLKQKAIEAKMEENIEKTALKNETLKEVFIFIKYLFFKNNINIGCLFQ